MKTAPSIAAPALFHKMYMALAMLAASLLLLGAPRQASAQNDVLRVLAERVLQNRNGVSNGRDNSSRERDEWERERRAREAFCRRNRNDRRCDNYDSYDDYSNRRGAWCLDRDHDNRCDASNARHDNGRHRGWEKDDDGWKRGRKNGRR